MYRTTSFLSLVLGCVFFIGCSSSKNQNCIDESKISEGPCTMEHRPVCGCDGKTYGNPCQAERSGVTSWKEGDCGDQS